MRYYLLLMVLISGTAFTQLQGSEIGIDGYFGASSNGGSFGIGVKYGLKPTENLIVGPCVRYQRTWSNYYSQKFGFNIFGGGFFVHYRIINYFFVGTEVEFLSTPVNYTNVYSTKHLVPTAFVGGGIAYPFESFRLNLGVFYDVIDDPNSPFRPSYVLQKTNGVLVPLIYRIGLFFPLN